MSSPSFVAYRQRILAEVSGEVLEIGLGTGLNLPYYSEAVTRLVGIDANKGTHRLAQQRLEQAPIPVELKVLRGEALPFETGHFDCVVSTWTLCSIAGVEQALREIQRVLRSGGRFYFVEHGLGETESIRTWQHRLTPLQKVIADGCHLDRDIEGLIRKQFAQVEVHRDYLPSTPKVLGSLYWGIATKP